MPNPEKIWTRTFILLCVVQTLGYAQHGMMVSILPLWITHLDGSASTTGIVLGLVGISGIIIRPYLGKLSDRIGEGKLTIWGNLLTSVCSVLFLIPAIPSVMLVNFIRGIGWGAINISGYAILSKISGKERNTEKSSHFRSLQLTAVSAFPAAAVWLLNHSNFELVFIATALLTLCGAFLAVPLARKLPPNNKEPINNAQLLRPIDKSIRVPFTLAVILYVSISSVQAFAVLYARSQGIENIWWHFIAQGAAIAAAPWILGKRLDMVKKRTAITSAFLVQVAAFVSIVSAGNLLGLVFGGVLYALSNSIAGAAIQALVNSAADDSYSRRGEIVGGYAMANPIANALGGLLVGALADWFGFTSMYLVMAAISLSGVAMTQLKLKIAEEGNDKSSYRNHGVTLNREHGKSSRTR
jgi:MFS family permease